MFQNIYKLLTFFLLVQTLSFSYGQNTLILDITQPKGQNQSELILNQLLYFDSIHEEDSLNYYILKGHNFCKKIDVSNSKDARLIELGGDIYAFIAQHLTKKNQFSEALLTYNKAQYFYGINDNKLKIAFCLNRMGDIYQDLGNQVDALNNYYKSNAISLLLKDSTQIALTFVNIAKIYRSQEDYQKTQEILMNALTIMNGVDNPYILCRIKKSIANLKVELGETEEALSLLQEALSLAKTSNNDALTAQILNDIGDVYIEKEEFEKAKGFFQRALKLATEEKYYQESAISLNNLGKYYFYTHKYDEGVGFASRSLAIGDEIQLENVRTEAINLLLKIYEKQKNWKKAFYFQGLLIEQTEKKEKNTIEQVLLKEKVRLDQEKNRFIVRKKEVEDTLVSEKENHHQDALYIAGGLFFVLLITILLIIYLRLRASREKNRYITKQSEERKLLLKEVHHRVKNNFQIVCSMLRLQSYNFEGDELQSNFNEAISRINAMAIVHEVIYQQEEFRNINAKSYLEKLIKILQETGHYQVTIIVESEDFPLKIETLISLGIILNELITNSFKHAFNEFQGSPKIKITLKSTGEKSYELDYKDNGIGIPKDLPSNFGMDLIDTIIGNYDGSVTLINDPGWATSIKINFLEF